MTAATFPRALARTLKYEGGNDDDPRDPGGRTSRGITQREYDLWRVKRALTPRDVWTAGDDEVATIYKDEYWDRGRCGALPAGIDFATFDANVNSGLGKGARWLQQALNDNGKDVVVDDAVGTETVGASLAVVDKPAVVRAEAARRSSFLHGLKNWSIYGGGWGRRVADVEAYGVQLALEGAGKTPAEVKDELNKQSGTAQVDRTKAQTGAGGAVAGGAAAGGSTQIDPSALAGMPHWAMWLTICLAAVAVIYFAVKSSKHGQRASAYAAAAAAITTEGTKA